MGIYKRFAKPKYDKMGKIEADEIKTSKNENYFELAPLIQTAYDLGSLYPTFDDLRKIGKVIDNVLQTSDDVIVNFRTYPDEIKKYINLYLDEETGKVSYYTVDDDGNEVENEIIPNNAKLDGDNLIDIEGNIKLEIDKINENAQKYINLYIDDNNHIYMFDEDGNKIYKIIKDNVIIDENVLKINDDTLLDLEKNVIKNNDDLIVNDEVILELDKNIIYDNDDKIIKTNDDTLLELGKNVIKDGDKLIVDGTAVLELDKNIIYDDENGVIKTNDNTLLDLDKNIIYDDAKGVIKTNDDTLLDLDKNIIYDDENGVIKTNDDTLLDLDENIFYENGIIKTKSKDLIVTDINAMLEDDTLFNNDGTSIDINYSKIEPVTGEIQFFIDTSEADNCKVIFKSEKIDNEAISFNRDGTGIIEINIDVDKFVTDSSMILTGIIDENPRNVFLQFSKNDDGNITKITVTVNDKDGEAVDSFVNLLWKL